MMSWLWVELQNDTNTTAADVSPFYSVFSVFGGGAV